MLPEKGVTARNTLQHRFGIVFPLATNIYITGIANFIDEWSHWDFCFTSFGVMLENLESSITTKKKPFSDFPARAPGMYNYRDGYTE